MSCTYCLQLRMEARMPAHNHLGIFEGVNFARNSALRRSLERATPMRDFAGFTVAFGIVGLCMFFLW